MAHQNDGPAPEFNAAAREGDQGRGPASQYQIDELNKTRPHPELAQHYQPNGPVRAEVNRQVALAENARIDQQVEAWRAQMRERDDQARAAFEKARGGNSR